MSRARADSELLPLSGFLIPWPLVIGESEFYKTVTAFHLRKESRRWMGLLREALRRGQRKACFPMKVLGNHKNESNTACVLVCSMSHTNNHSPSKTFQNISHSLEFKCRMQNCNHTYLSIIISVLHLSLCLCMCLLRHAYGGQETPF